MAIDTSYFGLGAAQNIFTGFEQFGWAVTIGNVLDGNDQTNTLADILANENINLRATPVINIPELGTYRLTTDHPQLASPYSATFCAVLALDDLGNPFAAISIEPFKLTIPASNDLQTVHTYLAEFGT